MRNVVFVCNSSYQILISAIMCHLHYENDYTIVALDEYFYKTIVHRYDFDNCPYFKCVICLRDEFLADDIKEVFDFNIDKVHLFNWGNKCSQMIYDKCSCAVEVTDEGIGSYQLQQMWLHRGIRFDKVQRIWLLTPDFSQDKELSIPISKISLDSIVQDYKQKLIFLKNINELFGYEPVKLPSIIYFDRYFVSGNMMPTSYERYFLSQMIPVLSQYSFCVKTHPSENRKIAEYRYREMDVDFYNLNCIPWEVVLLNQDIGSVIVLISVNSTPIILSKFIAACLGVRVVSICLIDMVSEYVDSEERFVEALVDRYNEVFPNEIIFRAKDVQQLENILSVEIGVKRKNCSESSIGFQKSNEIDWLRNQVLWYSKAFGNMLDVVQITASDIEGNIVCVEQKFFSWGDRRCCVCILIDNEWRNVESIRIEFGVRGIVSRVKNVVIRSKDYCVEYMEETSAVICIDSFERIVEYLDISFEFILPLLPYNYRDFTE